MLSITPVSYTHLMRTIDFRVVIGTEDEENEKLNQKFIAE